MVLKNLHDLNTETIPSICLRDLGAANCYRRKVTCETDARAPHRDNFLNFVFIESGEVTLNVEMTSEVVHGPAFFFVLPGQIHSYTVAPESRVYFVGMEEFFLPKAVFSALVNVGDDPRQQVVTQSAFLTDIFTLLGIIFAPQMADSASDELVFTLQKAVVQMIGLSLPAREKAEVVAEAEPDSGSFAQEFKTLVSLNFRHAKMPSDYAQKLEISVSYLTKLVRQSFGCTPGHFIRTAVVQEAKRLLFYTHLSVTDVAQDLGYEDCSYFSRLFAKSEGMTPLEFRNVVRSATKEKSTRSCADRRKACSRPQR